MDIKIKIFLNTLLLSGKMPLKMKCGKNICLVETHPQFKTNNWFIIFLREHCCNGFGKLHYSIIKET